MRAMARLLLLVLTASVLAACLPVTTKTPVGTTAGLGADPALIGAWRVLPQPGQDDAPGYVHIIASDQGGLIAVLVSTGSAAHPGDLDIYGVTTSQLGTQQLMNVHFLFGHSGPAKASEAAMNIPLAYRFDGKDRLTLYLIDEDAAKAAVRAGRIEGTIGPGQDGDVALTAAADKLDAFFASAEGAALFKQPLLRLKRME